MQRICVLLVGVATVFAMGKLHATGTDFTYVVAQDGSGDFASIQAAIDASKAFPNKRVTIFIKSGRYSEKITIPSWNTNLSLVGQHRDSTIISWNDHFNGINRGRNSTFFTATLRVDANDVLLSNLTIENTAGPVGQAIALHIEGDRVAVDNCRILGYQDTLYLAGEGNRHFFKSCYIEGTTDFIFGGATALFDACELRSKKNSYITAASTPEKENFGFVFLNCKLTSTEQVDSVFLGRPWRNFARTVFINSWMGAHIRPEGWHNWNKKEAEGTVFYAEANNIGPGAQTNHRVAWSHQLTASEIKNYTPVNIFRGWVPETLIHTRN